MNSQQFLIRSLLESYQNNAEELRKKLFDNGILTKDYPDDGLMLLYHKYDSPITSELERECRSLVIDRETYQIKAYSCENPRINKEGMNYLLSNSMQHQIITMCYEGTYLSVFNHNNKWYVSTRRCLDSQDSVFGLDKEAKSHYDMFDEILRNANYNGFSDFSQHLDPNYSYYFVLIHYQNKHFIDYKNKFGNNYGRLCLTSIRNSTMDELDIYENKVSFASYDNLDKLIFVPEKLSSIDEFAEFNKNVDLNAVPESEGVVIRIWNTEMNKYNLVKLQNINYQFYQVLGNDKNIYKGMIYLYQNDKLLDYFNKNINSSNFKKITNPNNPNEIYDTVGAVDSVFKVCTSELFELFKILWSLKTGKNQNKELYDVLPKEYRDILFAVRGIFYKKRALYYQNLNSNTTVNNNTYLRINDIYNYLKSLSTETIASFLKVRKLMFNWVKMEPKNQTLIQFNNISNKCDKVHLKLCTIFTNKLHTNITTNDLPLIQNSI